MSVIEKISFSESGFIQDHSAFMTLFVREGLFHGFYNRFIPLFLMQIRSDGRSGFFGGKIEYGEKTEDGARREFFEETGYKFEGPLELVSTYRVRSRAGERARHSFAAEVTRGEMQKVIESISTNILGNLEETHGFRLVPVDPEPRGKSLDGLIRTRLPASTAEHIIDLIRHYDFIPEGDILWLASKINSNDRGTKIPHAKL